MPDFHIPHNNLLFSTIYNQSGKVALKMLPVISSCRQEDTLMQRSEARATYVILFLFLLFLVYIFGYFTRKESKFTVMDRRNSDIISNTNKVKNNDSVKNTRILKPLYLRKKTKM